MNLEMVLEISMEALVCVMVVIGPPLVAAMSAGLIIAILQSATQIQETSLTFVPKILAIGLTVLFTGRWSTNHLIKFVQEIMLKVEGMGHL